jgi:hypothetical protein
MNPLNVSISVFAAICCAAALVLFTVAALLPAFAGVVLAQCVAQALVWAACKYFADQAMRPVRYALIVIAWLFWAICMAHIVGAFS